MNYCDWCHATWASPLVTVFEHKTYCSFRPYLCRDCCKMIPQFDYRFHKKVCGMTPVETYSRKLKLT